MPRSVSRTLIERPTDAIGGLARPRRARSPRALGQCPVLLTILLAGMLLSQLIEEKSNKIIEVLAAAVPIDAIFLGKLFAMLAHVAARHRWCGSAPARCVDRRLRGQGGIAALPAPAVGWPAFLALGVALFRDELSAARRGVPRHRRPGLDRARGADPVDAGDHRPGADLRPRRPSRSALRIRPQGWPPRSSPCPRRWRWSPAPPSGPSSGRTSRRSLWQTLWVALILHWGAKLFRKTVLKSGPQRKWWRRARA